MICNDVLSASLLLKRDERDVMLSFQEHEDVNQCQSSGNIIEMQLMYVSRKFSDEQHVANLVDCRCKSMDNVAIRCSLGSNEDHLNNDTGKGMFEKRHLCLQAYVILESLVLQWFAKPR
jgi:hypothetical protein